MRISLLAIGLAAMASPVLAADPPQTDDVKVNQLIVYGSDPCPASSDDQITVCARKPEDDRFRIPEPLRDNPDAPYNEAWINRAEQLEYVGRTGIGSCSPVGPGGGIGCYQQLVREAKAERVHNDDVNWIRLVEEARQQRLGKIDAAAAADEEAAKARGE
jgi:hypothetical protein